MPIQSVYAREVLDSRGLPTVEVSIWLDNGVMVSSSAPAGTSLGKYESRELRDNDPKHMNGMGVIQAINNVNNVIAPKLIGQDPTKQTAVDQLLVNLDGTHDKTALGSNALIAVSQAVLKAGAAAVNMPLFYYIKEKYQLTQTLQVPTTMFTMISGGAHGAGNLDIQEFQIVPASHFSFPENLNMGVQVYQLLDTVLKSKGAIHSVGIGGGFAPNLYHNLDAFEILIETIHNTQYAFGRDVFFGVDVAADTLANGGRYTLKDNPDPFTPTQLLEYYETLRKTYHVISIEDGFGQDDWKNWEQLTQQLGETTMILGDNLLSTNKTRLQKSIQEKSCNAILIKPNQIGTISETVEVVKIARDAGIKVVVSHRSGETNDDFIADFGVGVGADYVKFGAPARGERVAKYNRLGMIHALIEQAKNPS
jgi:enolase